MAQLTDDCFAFGGPMLTVDQAAALVAARISPLEASESVPLVDALGRSLAHDLVAALPLPPFRNSAVDGYAVRHVDLRAEGPTRLPVAGRVAAGASAGQASARGAAVRVFTGAPMPPDADTVFMQEDVSVDSDMVELPPGLARGANMRPAGEDIAPGEVALSAGVRLAPQHLAVAAALGRTTLDVRRKVRVGVFSTGDELTEPGTPLHDAGIYDSNRIMLMALVSRAGGEAIDLGIVRDRKAELSARLKAAAADCDLILTSGGVSTGEEDHVRPAVEEVGSLVFWRLGIKPGRPVAMGVIGGAAFMGLPGNPVAVFVTFAFVVRPLLARLAGEVWRAPRRWPVELGFPYRKKPGRREYVRVRLEDSGGKVIARKHPRDGAGMLSSLTETDGLIELVEERTRVEAGETAPFLAFGDLV